MNLDTLISRVSPVWAARRAERRLRARVTEEREQALLALAAHEAAEFSRTTADWNTRLLSSDQATIPDQPSAIARARDAIRNDWAAVSIVDGHVRHVVGIGITPRANARHPGTGKPLDEFNKAADRLWYGWARDKTLCHTERHWNFTGLEALTVREEVTAGVSIALFNYTPRVNDIGVHIQIVEFEQLVAWLVKNPDTGFWIRNGVEIDDFGAPAALWVFTKGHPLEYIQGRMAYTRIPFDRVLMSMRPERVRQSQGMGRLTPILQPLHHNKLYELYSVLRARAEAITGVSIESDLDASAPGSQAGAFGGAGQGSGGRGREIVLQPNMINELAPGKRMVFHAPTTPGAQYAPFSRTQATKFAAGAGLDYPTVARDFSGMTYSGQLQGRLETWAETDPAQQRLIDDFCRPIRDKVITMAILEGRLPAPNFDNPEWRDAYLEAEWRGPQKGSIDPSKDRAADKISLDYKLATRRDILNEENRDVREVISQYSDEVRLGQEQDPPVEFPDAQPKPAISPNEPRPGAQDDRQKKGLSLAANVNELLDRIETLEGLVALHNDNHDEKGRFASGSGAKGSSGARTDYGYGKDETGNLSAEAHNWLQAWQWGSEALHGQIPVPSESVIKELAPYRPANKVLLYRAVGPESALDAQRSWQSWTRNEKHARIIASEEGDPEAEKLKPGFRIVKRTWYPDEILVDTTTLPEKYNAQYEADGQEEVVVAYGKALHELTRVRANAALSETPARSDEAVALFNPNHDEQGRFSEGPGGGAAAGDVEALPLPPKDAPEELKNLYRERQREYTRANKPGISDAEKKAHLDRVEELKGQIDKARKEHPEWFAKGPGERKPPADKPAAPPASPPGAKTAKNLKQQFKEHQGVSLRFVHLDHEVDPDERPEDFVNKTYFEMADRVDKALTATRSQFGNDFKLRCERTPLRKFEVSDAGTLSYRGGDGRQHSDAVGLYDPWNNHITVAAAYLTHGQYDSPRIGRWVVDDTFEGTVRHEFGHYVQDHLLSAKEKALWAQKFNDVDLNPTLPKNAIAKHISKYAPTNSKECFAESFCAYTHPGYRRGMLPPEFEDFFDNLVFEKTEKQIGESPALLDSPWRK